MLRGYVYTFHVRSRIRARACCVHRARTATQRPRIERAQCIVRTVVDAEVAEGALFAGDA